MSVKNQYFIFQILKIAGQDLFYRCDFKEVYFVIENNVTFTDCNFFQPEFDKDVELPEGASVTATVKYGEFTLTFEDCFISLT